MRPPSLSAGSAILLATLLHAGTAGAQEFRPANSAPHFHKLTLINGGLPRVAYFVEGGSPHDRALARSLQFTENELKIVEEDQQLRMDALARAQRWGFPPAFGYSGYGYDPSSAPTNTALLLIRLQEEIQSAMAEARRPAPWNGLAAWRQAGPADRVAKALPKGRLLRAQPQPSPVAAPVSASHPVSAKPTQSEEKKAGKWKYPAYGEEPTRSTDPVARR